MPTGKLRAISSQLCRPGRKVTVMTTEMDRGEQIGDTANPRSTARTALRVTVESPLSRTRWPMSDPTTPTEPKFSGTDNSPVPNARL